jgi:hypothetical protein
MGREVVLDRNGVDCDNQEQSLAKCLTLHIWTMNAEQQVCRGVLPLPLELQGVTCGIPVEGHGYGNLGGYVVHVRTFNVPHYWKDTAWMTGQVKLDFPNVGSERSFICNDQLFPEIINAF